MSRAEKKKSEEHVSVPLTLREIEMSVYGLKIWRQVIVAQGFAQFGRDSRQLSETLVDIDLALEKFDQAKGK